MNPKVISQKFGFAVYPSVFVKGFKKDRKTNKLKFGNVKHLLFGDWIGLKFDDSGKPLTQEINGKNYYKVRARNKDGYILEDDIQAERILEVNFVDIGQGDGCHLVTPDDKHFIIDAGNFDNMYRFLKWRFNLRSAKSAPPPFTIVVSHSDADHYAGFSKIFKTNGINAQKITINKVYHNGMVEFSGEKVDSLGTIVESNGRKYVTDLCDSNADYNARASSGSGKYIQVLNLTQAPKESLRLGSQPIYKKGNMEIAVLGPVAKKIAQKDALPVFENNKGKTKNGHSIILKLTIGNLRLMLGGDLNEESEDYLLTHYTNIDVEKIRLELKNKDLEVAKRKELEADLSKASIKARETFEVDIAKSCHHGSSDFTSEFLMALNPIATVISSGDDEPHCHPRPDTLGTIGKYSRGKRSLIFSTELARSSKEFVDKIESLDRQRAVTVYGMINVRTDGNNVIIAQKLERPAARGSWDIHALVWNSQLKEFEYKDI